MNIEYGRLNSVTARALIAALHRDGFELVPQKGSHRHFRHLDTFRAGTLRSMMEIQARRSAGDRQRLHLLP